MYCKIQRMSTTEYLEGREYYLLKFREFSGLEGSVVQLSTVWQHLFGIFSDSFVIGNYQSHFSRIQTTTLRRRWPAGVITIHNVLSCFFIDFNVRNHFNVLAVLLSNIMEVNFIGLKHELDGSIGSRTFCHHPPIIAGTGFRMHSSG